MNSPHIRSLIMGMLCSLVGIAIGVYISLNHYDDVWKKYFFVFSGFSAFITSVILWWLIVERKKSHTIVRAVTAGSLSGLLAHYTCWYLLLLALNFSYWVLGNSGSSLGEAPIDPLNAIWSAVIYCLWSWLFFGWITVPAGGIIGGCYKWFIKQRIEKISV